MEKLHQYAAIQAYEAYQTDKKEGFWKIFVFPLAKFFQNYFWRLGFLFLLKCANNFNLLPSSE